MTEDQQLDPTLEEKNPEAEDGGMAEAKQTETRISSEENAKVTAENEGFAIGKEVQLPMFGEKGIGTIGTITDYALVVHHGREVAGVKVRYETRYGRPTEDTFALAVLYELNPVTKKEIKEPLELEERTSLPFCQAGHRVHGLDRRENEETWETIGQEAISAIEGVPIQQLKKEILGSEEVQKAYKNWLDNSKKLISKSEGRIVHVASSASPETMKYAQHSATPLVMQNIRLREANKEIHGFLLEAGAVKY